MIEYFIAELDKPINAFKMILNFLNNYLEEEASENNFRQNQRNVLALIYAIQLIGEDVLKIRKNYYKQMVEEKYPN